MHAKTWLEEHVETFVRPYIPVPDVYKDIKTFNYWKDEYFKALIELWQAAKIKSKGRMIFLPGRDTFLFEVLARLDNYPTIFRSEMSGSVAAAYQELKIKHPWNDCYMLDSGYSGSIAKRLDIKEWALVSFAGRIDRSKQLGQIIPEDLSGRYSSMASYLEGTPKYWNRGNATATQDKPTGKLIYKDPIEIKQVLLPLYDAKRDGSDFFYTPLEPTKHALPLECYDYAIRVTIRLANYWIAQQPTIVSAPVYKAKISSLGRLL